MARRRKAFDDLAGPSRRGNEQGVRSPAAYSPALNAGFQAAASTVQDMHQAIAGKTFDSLLRVPGLSVPTRIVQSVHDAITQGVYAAVRHGGGLAFSMAADAERLAGPRWTVGAREQAVRSALNGAVGDSLAASGSGLAVSMGLHTKGAPLTLDAASAAALRPRVCVFIHGLACDEQSWALRTEAWNSSPWADTLGAGATIQYGELLEHELGLSAIQLRYNTGLSIDSNAQQLAELLERAACAAPQVADWTLIGHSMGGLVARRAQVLAAEQGMRWAGCTSQIVCLGSPHQGAPLEKLGGAAVRALNLSEASRPLARLADKRSRGVKDLRRGLAGRKNSATGVLGTPALRLVFATLGDEASTLVGNLFGKMFGDGLVTVASASDVGLSGDVERVGIAGLGHMGLLNHPRVYEVLRRWLGASEVD